MRNGTRGWLHLLNVRGIPVNVHWTVPLGGMLVSRLNHSGAWQTFWLCLAYPLLILAHEAGHAIAAHLSGTRVLGIWLRGLGGHCKVLGLRSNKATFAVYSGGIVAQLFLLMAASAYVAIAGWPHDVLSESLVATFTFVNVALIAFALIPHASQGQVTDGYVLMKLAHHVLTRKTGPVDIKGTAAPSEPGPVFSPETHLLDKAGFAPRGFSVGVEILNDDTTPMDFVVDTLMRNLEVTQDEAMRLMFEIHVTGGAVVALPDIGTAKRVAHDIMMEASASGRAFVCRAVEARGNGE